MQIVLQKNSNTAVFHCSPDGTESSKKKGTCFLRLASAIVSRGRNETINSIGRVRRKIDDAIRPHDSARIAIFLGVSTAFNLTRIIFTLAPSTRNGL
jgi:hypothetical protein